MTCQMFKLEALGSFTVNFSGKKLCICRDLLISEAWGGAHPDKPTKVVAGTVFGL